jgi:conjugative transfer region protein TrbK
MDGKLLARAGAAAFVAIAITMAVLQLREEPVPPSENMVSVFEPDGDPLPAQLKICSEMGELALSWPDCRAAWEEKRRRFLGGETHMSAPPVEAKAN